MQVKLAIFALLGTEVYLGIAILGWGGWAAFFSHPPLVALVIVTLALAGLSGFTEGNLSKASARIVLTAGSLPPSG
jgi:hypothetical protein